MFSRAYRIAITVPPLAWVTIFLLVPYLLMFCFSFWSVSSTQTILRSWTLQNYKQLFMKDVYWETLLRSMWIAARVMMFSLALGYPLAYFLSFYAGKRKDLLYQMVIIPLWVSYLVRAYAWKTILGSDGVLNTLLQYAHLTQHPLDFLLYSPFAVVLTLTHIYTPFAFLPIYAALEHIPRNLVEASNGLARNFPAVNSRGGRGSYVCVRAESGGLSGSAVARGAERHHDFEHRGDTVRRGL
jgi:spermidine/putrescine transport system permease protein